MTGARQSDVAARLQAQLEKLRTANPFRTLDVPIQVDADGVRQAYLSLTKRFHPNRFALESASTRDLANEVFLLIRRAYDLLVDEDRRRQWRERVSPASSGTHPHVTAGPPSQPAVPTVGAGKPSQPVVPTVGTRPNPQPPPGAMGTPTPAATQRVATLGAPRASTVAASPPPPSVPPGTPRSVTPPSGASARTSSPQSPTAAPSRTPTMTTPTVRTPTVTTPTVRTPTMPGPPGSVPPGGSPATRRPSGPPTVGAKPEEVQAMLEAARTRGQRFDDAVALIGRGKYKDAREAFYKIAMEDPQSKRYRIQLHYAWGLEHLADGKPAEAQRELERALALEPENHDIRSALAKAQEQQKKPSGILGKLFGR